MECLNKSYRLCEDHFEANMFTNHLRERLNANAIPTLFPSFEGSSKDPVVAEHNYNKPVLVPTRINILQNVLISPETRSPTKGQYFTF